MDKQAMFRCVNRSALRLQASWEECLPLARAAGFEGFDVEIQPQDSAAKHRDALAKHGLRPGGVPMPFDFRQEIGATKEGVATLERVASVASEVGSTRFYTFLYAYSDTMPWKENFRWHVERLKPLARVMEQHGCRFGLEYVAPRSFRAGHRYTFVHSLHPTLDLCEAIGPNCGLLLDSWHWYNSLGTLEDILALRAEQVVYVHVNDAPEGIPLDQRMDQDRRLPGETGVIDLPAFLGALRTIGYNGPVTPEPFRNEFRTMLPADVLNRVGEVFGKAWQRPVRPRLPQTMKVLGMGGRKAWVTEQPVPRPEGNQVVVKLHASLICGSNMGRFVADGEHINGGHEGAGEVVAVAHSTRLKVGDRVALAPITACGVCEDCLRGDVIFCRHRPPFEGNFAQFTKVADVICTKLPDAIDFVQGSMLGCGLGPAFEATRAVGVHAFDCVVVAGLGPVGLGAVALSSFMGAQVIGLDPEKYRRDLASSVGASMVLDPTDPRIKEKLAEITGGRGILHGIDCSGKEASQRLLIDCAGVRGRIAFVGENHEPIPITPSKDFIRKGLRVTGCWHTNMNDSVHLLNFIRRAPEKVDKLITHRFPLEEAQKAFDTFAGRQCAKVALLPWE